MPLGSIKRLFGVIVMGRWMTIGVWTLSLLILTLQGLVAAAFVVMAASLDPTDLVTTGVEPWTDAISASLAFGGLVLATALSLRFWYSARFRMIGLALTGIEFGYVTWVCTRLYRDYF